MSETLSQEADLQQLGELARNLRLDVLDVTTGAASGHPSSSFSSVEILTALYFGGVLRFRPAEPDWPERDRFLLSKGPAAPLLYAVLSMAAYDLDGDGQLEIVCGEHDPFWPYRNRCRLLVYKKANAEGTAWYRYTLDDRFEHHDGTKIFEISPGRLGIISHGWKDSIYVHLWEAY